MNGIFNTEGKNNKIARLFNSEKNRECLLLKKIWKESNIFQMKN